MSHVDDRQKIISVVKAENASQERFAQGEEIFGTKRWEDDWLRIYQYAATAGYLGNMISILLGLSGGIYLCYNLTSNWAVAISIGTVVVLIMEVTKSVSLREATIHLLKGKQLSGMVLSLIAISMIVASAYFSVESGKKTPYFQKWVQTENTTTLSAAPTTNQYNEKIAQLRAELRSIDTERDAYTAKNPSKGAKWLKADRYESLKAEIASIEKEAATNTAEKQAISNQEATTNTENSLSWWYWAIVILSELCVLFGYCFRPYYLYRCRELAIIEGKTINRANLQVSNNATHYTPTTGQTEQELLDEIQLLKEAIAKSNTSTPQNMQTQQDLLAEIERLRAMPQQKPPTNNANITNNTIGFKHHRQDVPTVDTPILAVSTVDTAQTDLSTYDDETLLGYYRSLNSKKKSWETRKTQVAQDNVVATEKVQQSIMNELASRQKKIVKTGQKFAIIPL